MHVRHTRTIGQLQLEDGTPHFLRAGCQTAHMALQLDNLLMLLGSNGLLVGDETDVNPQT